MSDFFQIYYKNIPEINENVLIKFTEKNDSHIEGELVEYNLKAIMSYNDATKKKKINSWNKIMPLNKLLIAKVEEVFSNNLVQVSMAYNDKNTEIKEQLKPFTENKILLSIVKKICYQYELNLNNFWITIIHPFDKLRKEENNNLSILNYIKINLDLLKTLINNDEIYNKFIENYVNNSKITSKIGLISMYGIDETKKLIKNITSNDNIFNFNFKYDTAPYYILDSCSNESTIDNHEQFIKKLELQSKEYKIFVKIEYIGKTN